MLFHVARSANEIFSVVDYLCNIFSRLILLVAFFNQNSATFVIHELYYKVFSIRGWHAYRTRSGSSLTTLWLKLVRTVFIKHNDDHHVSNSM